jgi:phenol 2-monooxygenase
MNTGMHDAVNFAWKLGGVLKGWYKSQVLRTYSPERRAIAQHLIDVDKNISVLISAEIPESYVGDAHGGDVNLVLLDNIESASQFTTGLELSCVPDGVLNRPSGVSNVQAGRRAPDVIVRKPGSSLPTRLYESTKNNGKFWIIVFTGEPLRTAKSLKKLRAYVNSANSFVNLLEGAFDFLTTIAGPGLQPDETLGVDKFGRAYYDVDHSAFVEYGISTEGAIVVQA